MLIEINTDRLIKSNLTADEYILLYLLFSGLYGAFDMYYLEFDIENALNKLKDKNYILSIPDVYDSSKILINKSAAQKILAHCFCPYGNW